MREFKSSSVRIRADEFIKVMAAITYYTADLDRNDDRDAALLFDYDALTDHMYRDYLNSDNFETYPDPDEESEI